MEKVPKSEARHRKKVQVTQDRAPRRWPKAPMETKWRPKARPRRYSCDRCCLNIFLGVLGSQLDAHATPKGP